MQKSEFVIPAEASNPVFSRASGPPLEIIPTKAGTRVTPLFSFAIASETMKDPYDTSLVCCMKDYLVSLSVLFSQARIEPPGEVKIRGDGVWEQKGSLKE